MSQKLVPYVHLDGKGWDHFFVDVNSQVIYFERRINGKKIKFSTREKVPNGSKAKTFANKELERRLGKKRLHVRTLISEELNDFWKVKESEGHKEDTMNNIRRAVSEIREFWGDKLPSEITEDTIPEWFQWWKENKNIEMENVVKYMRNFCGYLSRKVVNGHPLLPAVPKISVPNRKEIKAARKKKKENVLTLGQFKTIFETGASLEEKVLVLMMFTMATRVTETLEMAFDSEIYIEVDQPYYKWRIDQNKAGLDGRHILHPSLIPLLKDLKAQREASGTKLLFPQTWNIQSPKKAQQIGWADWRKRANIPFHWTAHTLRHTCLTNLFNNPKNPQLLICKLYRISYKEAEETYVHPTDEGRASVSLGIEVKL